jgi:hypothetical protein
MSDESGIEPRKKAAASGLSSVSVTAPITGDGTSGNPLTMSPASGTAAGSMSATDKTKLDGIAASATNTPLSSTTPANVGTAAIGVGAKMIAADSVSGQRCVGIDR